VASGLSILDSLQAPFPFLRSIPQVLATAPPLVSKISKLKVAPTFLTASVPSPLNKNV